eukprot:TRINITY_DN2558_c0_g1_i4.p1 TRINITY_DN2558_c0_g1~~TRINITY_DN2558_c0_g1_i4.p1  ORF type:complete len:1053 (-),score=260.78 TRINITY_DN2558_c0_g1_i4:2493-5189(-)
MELTFAALQLHAVHCRGISWIAHVLARLRGHRELLPEGKTPKFLPETSDSKDDIKDVVTALSYFAEWNTVAHDHLTEDVLCEWVGAITTYWYPWAVSLYKENAPVALDRYQRMGKLFLRCAVKHWKDYKTMEKPLSFGFELLAKSEDLVQYFKMAMMSPGAPDEANLLQKQLVLCKAAHKHAPSLLATSKLEDVNYFVWTLQYFNTIQAISRGGRVPTDCDVATSEQLLREAASFADGRANAKAPLWLCCAALMRLAEAVAYLSGDTHATKWQPLLKEAIAHLKATVPLLLGTPSPPDGAQALPPAYTVLVRATKILRELKTKSLDKCTAENVGAFKAGITAYCEFIRMGFDWEGKTIMTTRDKGFFQQAQQQWPFEAYCILAELLAAHEPENGAELLECAHRAREIAQASGVAAAQRVPRVASLFKNYGHRLFCAGRYPEAVEPLQMACNVLSGAAEVLAATGKEHTIHIKFLLLSKCHEKNGSLKEAKDALLQGISCCRYVEGWESLVESYCRIEKEMFDVPEKLSSGTTESVKKSPHVDVVKQQAWIKSAKQVISTLEPFPVNDVSVVVQKQITKLQCLRCPIAVQQAVINKALTVFQVKESTLDVAKFLVEKAKLIRVDGTSHSRLPRFTEAKRLFRKAVNLLKSLTDGRTLSDCEQAVILDELAKAYTWLAVTVIFSTDDDSDCDSDADDGGVSSDDRDSGEDETGCCCGGAVVGDNCCDASSSSASGVGRSALDVTVPPGSVTYTSYSKVLALLNFALGSWHKLANYPAETITVSIRFIEATITVIQMAGDLLGFLASSTQQLMSYKLVIQLANVHQPKPTDYCFLVRFTVTSATRHTRSASSSRRCAFYTRWRAQAQQQVRALGLARCRSWLLHSVICFTVSTNYASRPVK